MIGINKKLVLFLFCFLLIVKFVYSAENYKNFNTAIYCRVYEVQKMKDLNFSSSNAGDYIDELENTPAYKRKKVKIDQVKHSEETKVSQYSLINDQDRHVKLSKDNPYLHDAID